MKIIEEFMTAIEVLNKDIEVVINILNYNDLSDTEKHQGENTDLLNAYGEIYELKKRISALESLVHDRWKPKEIIPEVGSRIIIHTDCGIFMGTYGMPLNEVVSNFGNKLTKWKNVIRWMPFS